MEKREVSKQSLLGQFYPCSYIKIKTNLDKWRVVLREPCKSRCIEEWDYLEGKCPEATVEEKSFDFSHFF